MNARIKAQDSRHKVQDSRYKNQGTRIKVQESRHKNTRHKNTIQLLNLSNRKERRVRKEIAKEFLCLVPCTLCLVPYTLSLVPCTLCLVPSNCAYIFLTSFVHETAPACF